MYKCLVERRLCVTIVLMKRSIFILFIICLFVGFSVAEAQIGGVDQSAVNVEMFPEYPGPNEEIGVILTSYAIDINSSTITWAVNGKTIKSGKGEKTFSFTTGDMNTTTTLRITVKTVDGQVINNSFTIRPASVDLIWQSEGYVPPFYKGKSLFSHQNKITFIAIPHIISNGVEISPKNLIYKWKKNGSVEESASGYGKDSYSIVGSIISRPLNIEVEVTASTGGSVAHGSVLVNPIEPLVVLYEINPTYGIKFQKALSGEVELKDSKEIWVVSAPFYFGTTNSSASELAYKWKINGGLIDNNTSQNTRIFRQAEGTSGVSNISLSIENTKKVLQYASNSFNLKFGENSN